MFVLSTHLQYEMLVDKNGEDANAASHFELQTFYGQLEHIYQVHFPVPVPELEIASPTTYIFAAIRACVLKPDDPQLRDLDIHFYSRRGALDLIDITTVQSLVGRIGLENSEWAIIDRSGSLARAVWAGDELVE
jgi:hypothetical protein